MKLDKGAAVLILVAAALSVATAAHARYVWQAKSEAMSAQARLTAEKSKPSLSEVERADLRGRTALIERAAEAQASPRPEVDAQGDPILIAATAKKAFTESGVRIKSYSTVKGGRDSLFTFQVDAEPSALATFLSAESAKDAGFGISRCAISFNVTPSILNAEVSICRGAANPVPAAPPPISRLFGKLEPTPRPRTSGPRFTPSPTQAEEKPAKAAWISFIGHAQSSDGVATFFFKDTKNGFMLEIPETGQNEAGTATIIAEKTDSFIIRYKGALLEIDK
jgi:hypothetical protein